MLSLCGVIEMQTVVTRAVHFPSLSSFGLHRGALSKVSVQALDTSNTDLRLWFYSECSEGETRFFQSLQICVFDDIL